jgi:hypothetical protein
MVLTRTPPAPTSEKGYVRRTSFWSAEEFEQAPELRGRAALQVYDRMRRTDAQVASVLRAVSLPVMSTEWFVDPAGARPEVAEHIATDLGLPLKGSDPVPMRRRGRFSWTEHLQLVMLMLPFGHMFFEQVLTEPDDNGLQHLRKLGPRMPRSISKINVAADGGLESIEQFGVKEPIEVNRLVAYVHQREGGNWLGSSLLRPAYKHWLLKDRALRVQMQTIERNGMGLPKYKGAPDEENLDKGAELAAKARAGDNSGIAVPDGADFELMGVTGSLPDADKPIRYHDEQIARAVLAHFLNLGTQTGSWALGTTFADFFTLSLQALADQIADVATQHIVEDLVDWNYGVDEPAPIVAHDEIGSKPEAMAGVLKALVDAGIVFPDRVLEEAVRQMFDLPAKATPPPATDA